MVSYIKIIILPSESLELFCACMHLMSNNNIVFAFSWQGVVLHMIRKRIYNTTYYMRKTDMKTGKAKCTKTVVEPGGYEYDKQLAELVKESKKRNPNLKSIKDLQSLTFKKRQDTVLNMVDVDDPAKEVLKTWPFLNKQQMVSVQLLEELQAYDCF